MRWRIRKPAIFVGVELLSQVDHATAADQILFKLPATLSPDRQHAEMFINDSDVA